MLVHTVRNQGSSVGIVTGYGFDGRGSIHGKSNNISVVDSVYPASSRIAIVWFSLGVLRLRREAHSDPQMTNYVLDNFTIRHAA
jgi:hypothetical protein